MFKKFIKSISFLALIGITNSLNAQVIITEDTDDGVTVTSHDNVDEYEDVSNIVKLSPLHFARGKFVLFDQFRLNPKTSMEFGAGVSFVDYLMTAYDAGEEEITFANEYGFGPHLEGSLIIHPGGDALLGYYAALNLRYSVTNYTYGGYDSAEVDGKVGYIKDFSFNMAFGYQDTDWTDSFVYDLYGGFGFINRSQTFVDYDNTLQQDIVDNKSGIVPTIVLGVKLGMITK